LTTRGDLTDKWHRVCVECGERHHVNALRHDVEHECDCGGTEFTRDRTNVTA
jgi:hypothetical protein